MKKNILSILDTKGEIENIIDLGIQLKKDFKNGKSIDYLKNKRLAMIFERASTRTRVSFEMGMALLGGHSVFLNSDEIKIGKRESVQDIALVLSRYVDIIVYRAIKKEDLHNMAKYATVPVINALDIDEHPCQILTDFMTIKEIKGKLKNLNFIFIGDGNDNLTHSYLLGCPLVGMNITVISPKKYWPTKYYIEQAKKLAHKKNLRVVLTEDIEKIKNADVVATDTWISLWDENERKQRLKDFQEFTITVDVMNKVKKKAIFIHCMPIYYGNEVVQEVAHGSKSVIIEEAENHLWSQMALMIYILKSFKKNEIK